MKARVRGRSRPQGTNSLIPDYKILHDAGYNVLAYDLRNFGHSGAANGVSPPAGSSRPGTSPARGHDAVPQGIRRCPLPGGAPAGHHEDHRQRRLALLGAPADRIDDLEQRVILRTSIGFARRAPRGWARYVRVPAFLYQVRDDVLTEPGDVQAMFDNIPVADKKLSWIRGTTRRCDGYLEFQRHPEPMLEWFAQHMS